MPRTERCESCLGTGFTEIPTIQEKIVHHLIYAGAHPEQQYGLQLAPAEVAELADALGIPPPPLQPADGAAQCARCRQPVDPHRFLEHECPPDAGPV